MARTSNDLVVIQQRIAMKQRAAACAKFIVTRRRKLAAGQLAKIIFTAWEGGPSHA